MADEQRTERATPRRREKARERGQLVRSRELPSALTLLAVAALLRWANGGFLPAWSGLLRHLLATGSRTDLASMASILDWTAWGIARWVLPPLGLAWGVSVMGLITQGGFVVTPLALQPKWDRLNPVNNISRIFSLGSLSTLLKSLVPVGVLLYLAVGILSRDWLQVTHTSQMGLPAALSWLAQVLYEFAWKGGMVLLVWAGVDYGLQRANYERSMRMSKQEIRDEHRDLEGNPATKRRIKRRFREMRRRKMMRQVARATVVITNPDEFAVALEYVPAKMAAPLVLAKGRGELAQKIKREARWYEVPIIENKPLAQALYRTVEVGGTIPAKLYTAVAEVLAFIYRAQAKARAEAQAKARPEGQGSTSPKPAGENPSPSGTRG
ncbi:MAG: EscU/YscU/HrcU family type III secretion system export apparatus switch protein [Candidatus Acidiferrales bacterium]